MGLGAASVKAQVRIGGNASPNAAAVLDLNETDDATPTGNKGGLALPRVILNSATAQLNNTQPITGMLVYNTNASMTGGTGAGLYYWGGSSWLRVDVPYSDNTYRVMTIVDSTITWPAYSNVTAFNFTNGRLSLGDWCTGQTNYVTAGSIHMLAFCATGNCPGGSARIICYHPTK